MFSILRESALLLALSGPQGPAPDAEVAPQRFDLLGLQFCVGDPGDSLPCHVRLFEPNTKSDTKYDTKSDTKPDEGARVQVSVLGHSVCIGDVPSEASCDWHIAGTDNDRVGA